MADHVYLIYSDKFDRFYVGHTSNLDQRLNLHNSGKVKSTKAFHPWKIVYVESFNSSEEARQREIYFKTAAGRRFLKEIKISSRVPRLNESFGQARPND